MAQNYARLQRADWDKLGPDALARELFNLLNTAPVTRADSASDGFYIKASESGTGLNFSVSLQAGGDGWDFGTVISGSGTTYKIKLNAGNTITATVPRVLVTGKQTIPANAKAIVIKLSDGTYRLIAALWFVQTTA